MAHQLHRILIIGGGFGGIAAALALQKHQDKEVNITLVSNLSHFEYHAALYRVMTGQSPLEVCIPLSTIFKHTVIKIVEDTITAINPEKKTVTGKDGSSYGYDSLIFGVGSQTQYYDVPGLQKYSFGVKSITEALELKQHLHELFYREYERQRLFSRVAKQKNQQPIHLVVAGGGATGVEVAGELAVYSRHLACNHRLDTSQITIDLFEAGKRLLSVMPIWASNLAERRLKALGVTVYLNTAILKEEVEQIYLKDMKMKTKTVIWTAGVGPNDLTRSLPAVTLSKQGKIEVDEHMQARGLVDFYVIGDAAATKYSGMAQTAILDGQFVARTIINQLRGQKTHSYQPQPPSYVVPIGPGWALGEMGGIRLEGKSGWIFRRLVDLRYFLEILPWRSALKVFQSGRRLTETCPTCLAAEKRSTISLEGGG